MALPYVALILDEALDPVPLVKANASLLIDPVLLGEVIYLFFYFLSKIV